MTGIKAGMRALLFRGTLSPAESFNAISERQTRNLYSTLLRAYCSELESKLFGKFSRRCARSENIGFLVGDLLGKCFGIPVLQTSNENAPGVTKGEPLLLISLIVLILHPEILKINLEPNFARPNAKILPTKTVRLSNYGHLFGA